MKKKQQPKKIINPVEDDLPILKKGILAFEEKDIDDVRQSSSKISRAETIRAINGSEVSIQFYEGEEEIAPNEEYDITYKGEDGRTKKLTVSGTYLTLKS